MFSCALLTMKLRKILILLLPILIVLYSCRKRNTIAVLTDDKLCEAIAIKDSALCFLSTIDTLSNFSEEETKRLAMLRAIAYYYGQGDALGDSVATDLIDYWSEQKSLSRALANLCAGLIFEANGQEEKALPCYVQAANDLKGSSKWGALSTVYTRWGWLLRTEPPYTEAQVKLELAGRYARQIKDNSRLAQICGMKGWAWLFYGDLQRSKTLFDEGVAIATKNHCNNLGWLLKSKASACEMMHQHKEALRYVNEAIAESKKEDKSLLGIKGTCFIGLGQYDSARYYIDKGHLEDHYYQKASYYSELSSLEEVQKNYSEALRYHKLYSLYVDSTYEEDRRLALAQADRRYNYAAVSAERDRYALDSQRKTALIIALFAVVCAVGIGALYLHQIYRRRTKDALRMKENLLEQTLAQVKERNYQLMETKQTAQDKEMELLSTLSYKDEQLAVLRRQQRELKERILHTNEVIRKIESLNRMNEKNKISSARDIALSEIERQNLIDSTNLCYDNFVDRLKSRFNDLNIDDVCLCCMLKLKVTAQDQAILLQISDSTLRTRKYRLKKKKMQLTDDFETLDDFIHIF